jgi:hypothetical protein
MNWNKLGRRRRERSITSHLVACAFAFVMGSQALAALGPDVGYGGFFVDGNLHTAPPNLVSRDPLFPPYLTRVGAFLSSTSRLVVASNGLIDAQSVERDAIGIYATAQSSVSVAPLAQITALELVNGKAFGVVGEDQAVISARGNFEITGNGNGDATVAQVSGFADLLLAGTGTGTQDASGDMIGLAASGAATSRIAGTFSLTDAGNGDVVGIDASGNSKTDFLGNFTLSESGNGDALPFRLKDQAQLTFRGNMLIEEDGNARRAGALVEGSAIANLEGGTLRIESDGLSGRAPIIMLELAGEAITRVSGGSYRVFEDGLPIVPRVTVNDGASLRLRGLIFNYPMGPISDASGR